LNDDQEPIRDDHGVERRRDGHADQSPIGTLKQLPALVVLERLPVPTLAIGQDGTILFANTAFVAMLGYTPHLPQTLTFHQLFHTPPVDHSPLSVVHERAENIVELLHADGSIVKALMSSSALLRGDDQVALTIFQDLTESLWAAEP
jgi:PAS domain S-box-containing protein